MLMKCWDLLFVTADLTVTQTLIGNFENNFLSPQWKTSTLLTSTYIYNNTTKKSYVWFSTFSLDKYLYYQSWDLWTFQNCKGKLVVVIHFLTFFPDCNPPSATFCILSLLLSGYWSNKDSILLHTLSSKKRSPMLVTGHFSDLHILIFKIKPRVELSLMKMSFLCLK